MVDPMETSKIKNQKSDKTQSPKFQTYFDLEERLAVFGEKVIVLCKSLPKDAITKPLVNQIVRSATSIGANYLEASNASSKKDFRNKLFIAKKEAQETKHWLRMLKASCPERVNELRELWQENHEICLILQSIANKLDIKRSEI